MAAKNNGGTYIEPVECSVCLKGIIHETDNLGFEGDKHLCKPCYSNIIDNYDGEVVDTQSFEIIYLQTRAELVDAKTHITTQNKKIKELQAKLKEVNDGR